MIILQRLSGLSMKRFLVCTLISAIVLFFLPVNGWTDEGMWLLDSISELPVAEMKSHGLQLTPEQIYSEHGPSLKDAIVLLGGGTASFVSAEGLLLTNHHVAFSGLQALSSVKDDYLQNGYWAKTKSEELPTTYTAQIVIGMRNVTADVLSAVGDTMSAVQRVAAIRSKSREIEHSAKGTTDYVCRVLEMYGGNEYYLFTYEIFRDVRLVYAPPSSIGNFGGEVDNWMWPRHTGDFSFMRVYAAPDNTPAPYAKGNLPYRPKVFLAISSQGYNEGSFAMIMGFPGRTYRYREAAAVRLAHDVTLPTVLDLYKTRIDIITDAGKSNREIQIKYASRVRGLENTYKNYRGTLEGMKRSDLLEVKEDEQRQFASYLHSTPELQNRYGSLLEQLSAADDELEHYEKTQRLLMNLSTGVDLLRVTARLRRDAGLHPLPPEPSFFARGRERETTQEFLSTVFKNLDISIDQQILETLILKDLDDPTYQHLKTFLKIVGDRTGESQIRRVRDFVHDLYDDTELSTLAGCEKLAAAGQDALKEDPFIKFAADIAEDQEPLAVAYTRINETLSALREKYIAAWIAWKDGTVTYPDANRSLRFTYGTVKSLEPRDAVEYRYYTTLNGVMEKEQNVEPFIVPPRLKELWRKKDYGRYADAKDGSMHVAFLADLDITGGNSGSPVMNGKGEIIGCAFDGNWESIVGDYYFQEEYNRTISVDARYILFVLDKFSGAENILKELIVN
jgi:hypothetical protein